MKWLCGQCMPLDLADFFPQDVGQYSGDPCWCCGRGTVDWPDREQYRAVTPSRVVALFVDLMMNQTTDAQIARFRSMRMLVDRMKEKERSTGKYQSILNFNELEQKEVAR